MRVFGAEKPAAFLVLRKGPQMGRVVYKPGKQERPVGKKAACLCGILLGTAAAREGIQGKNKNVLLTNTLGNCIISLYHGKVFCPRAENFLEGMYAAGPGRRGRKKGAASGRAL